jgi:hypothetical protein
MAPNLMALAASFCCAICLAVPFSPPRLLRCTRRPHARRFRVPQPLPIGFHKRPGVVPASVPVETSGKSRCYRVELLLVHAEEQSDDNAGHDELTRPPWIAVASPQWMGIGHKAGNADPQLTFVPPEPDKRATVGVPIPRCPRGSALVDRDRRFEAYRLTPPADGRTPRSERQVAAFATAVSIERFSAHRTVPRRRAVSGRGTAGRDVQRDVR